jgi:hypothetical protein
MPFAIWLALVDFYAGKHFLCTRDVPELDFELLYRCDAHPGFVAREMVRILVVDDLISDPSRVERACDHPEDDTPEPEGI